MSHQGTLLMYLLGKILGTLNASVLGKCRTLVYVVYLSTYI